MVSVQEQAPETAFVSWVALLQNTVNEFRKCSGCWLRWKPLLGDPH